MQKTIIDSGPLIALFDRSDKYHQRVLEFIKSYKGELITSWSVITEVSHMLDFNLQVQIDFLKWCEIGGIKLYDISQDEIVHIRVMMQKYIDVPMDLADATLMYISNKENIKNIVSIDSDFDIYRTLKKQSLNNLIKFI
ncbi:MAG: PIN domain-containing protein [Sulfurimonas sp.]|uniref:type II toxin-antitoxin system VapC family toxin n=1 Tax=Sulfurimonas sp. TaxID=2022749 RepID=UPI0025E252A8|nr:PIN domain-containing protein [Sulfurimonas sp.]MCK9491813.1 PIN domain-containing protein [Sulfurimonas sp.]